MSIRRRRGGRCSSRPRSCGTSSRSRLGLRPSRTAETTVGDNHRSVVAELILGSSQTAPVAWPVLGNPPWEPCLQGTRLLRARGAGVAAAFVACRCFRRHCRPRRRSIDGAAPLAASRWTRGVRCTHGRGHGRTHRLVVVPRHVVDSLMRQ